MPASRNWFGIGWNGSYYTVPAYGTAVMAVSKDGASWRELALSASSAWRYNFWNGNSFISLASSAANYIKITPDTGNFQLPTITTNVGGFASGYVGNYWIKT